MKATHPLSLITKDVSGTNITTAAYVQLLARTSAPVAPINKIDYYNGTGKTLFLSFGEAGSEVDVMLLLPGLHTGVDCVLPSGARISAKACIANATSGELAINLWG